MQSVWIRITGGPSVRQVGESPGFKKRFVAPIHLPLQFPSSLLRAILQDMLSFFFKKALSKYPRHSY